MLYLKIAKLWVGTDVFFFIKFGLKRLHTPTKATPATVHVSIFHVPAP